MKSPNFTVFVLVGLYLVSFLFKNSAEYFLGEKLLYLAICVTILPIFLIIRKKWSSALLLVMFTFVYVFMMTLIINGNLDLLEAEKLIQSLPFPLYAYFLVILPGLFMVSELEGERLPHELSHWTGLRAFRPLISVFATRERLIRRLETIRETSILRGIPLETKLQHIRHLNVWIVPLLTSAICEAAYAFRYREIVGSPHYFYPTNPRKPVLTLAQKLLFITLVMLFLVGIQRNYGL